MLIRGKSRSQVKQSLERYCAEAEYHGARRVFILNKRGFGYVATAILRKKPFLFLKWLVLLAAGKITALRLPLPVQAIRVKNNIRVFFGAAGQNSKPKTAKIAVQSRHRTGSLMQEIHARLRLADRQAGNFAVPRVIRYDEVGYNWLEEEFIEAQPSITERQKVEFFLREAPAMYARFRRPQNVSEAFAGMGLKSEHVHPLLAELEVDQGLLQGRWTASFIHGDLSPANMIIGTDDRLYLIDWELSKVAPVAWDLKKLFLHNKEGVLWVIEELRYQDDMASVDQMCVALLCELALLRRNGELRFSYLTSNRNKSDRAAQEMMALHDKRLVNSIRELTKA